MRSAEAVAQGTDLVGLRAALDRMPRLASGLVGCDNTANMVHEGLADKPQAPATESALQLLTRCVLLHLWLG